MTWVSPLRLTGRWQPEMFRAEYLALDQQIKSWKNVVRLGDLVSLVHNTSDATDVAWNISPLHGVSRYFPEPLTAEDNYDTKRTLLPSQAVLVARTWIGGQRIHYWDAGIYHGKGVADTQFFVLKSQRDESIAWLYRALVSESSRLQIERCAQGSTFRSITADDLLDVKLQLPPEGERVEVGRAVLEAERQSVMTLRSRTLTKSVVLVGRTYEERLDEFEELLVRELCPSGKAV